MSICLVKEREKSQRGETRQKEKKRKLGSSKKKEKERFNCPFIPFGDVQ
jgi:hypothetical protein